MTMRIETKSALILLGTFVLGALVGVLGAGAAAQRRMSRVAELRERGFAMHLERIIQPRDEEQREAVQTVLRAAAERNRGTMMEAQQQIRSSLERMQEELEPLLDEEQRARLEEASKRFRRGPPGGPFREPPPGRRPGAGRRPPGHDRPADGPPNDGPAPVDGERPPEPAGGAGGPG